THSEPSMRVVTAPSSCRKSIGRKRRVAFCLLELENGSFSFGIRRSGDGSYGDGTRVNRRLARADDFEALDDRWALVKCQRTARANGVDRHWVAEPVEDDLLSPRAEEICGGNLWNRGAAIVRNERFASLRENVVGKHLVGERAIVETAGLPGEHDYRSTFGGLHVDKGDLISVKKRMRNHARKNNRVVAH